MTQILSYIHTHTHTHTVVRIGPDQLSCLNVIYNFERISKEALSLNAIFLELLTAPLIIRERFDAAMLLD